MEIIHRLYLYYRYKKVFRGAAPQTSLRATDHERKLHAAKNELKVLRQINASRWIHARLLGERKNVAVSDYHLED